MSDELNGHCNTGPRIWVPNCPLRNRDSATQRYWAGIHPWFNNELWQDRTAANLLSFRAGQPEGNKRFEVITGVRCWIGVAQLRIGTLCECRVDMERTDGLFRRWNCH
jgi:hypothetical protein